MPVANDTIRQPWLYLDATDLPLTGQTTPADITFTLKRDSGAGTVDSAEAIAFNELGSGFYEIVFTPGSNGLYSLFLQELAGMGRRFLFSYEVLAPGSVLTPSYANAFCSEADIERWLQTPIDSTTNPNSTETVALAQTRAAVLMSLCSRWGLAVTPATITSGSLLELMLRDANAIGAALDYTIAQQLRQSPSRSERVDYFLGKWQEYYGQGPFAGTPGAKPAGPGYIETEIRGSLTSLASNHILSGDTAGPAPETPPQALPIGISMGDLF